MMSNRSSEILIRSLLMMASSSGASYSEYSIFAAQMRSTPTTGQRHGAHAEQGLEFGNNNFRWHRHASADMWAGVYAVAVWDGSSNFLCQPPGHVKFRNDNILGILCGFTDFLSRPRPQSLDFHQTATDTFILEETDGFTTL